MDKFVVADVSQKTQMQLIPRAPSAAARQFMMCDDDLYLMSQCGV